MKRSFGRGWGGWLTYDVDVCNQEGRAHTETSDRMYTIRDVIGINVLNPLVFSPMRKAIYGAKSSTIPFLEQSVIRRSSFLAVNVSLATSRYSGNTRLA